jgi:hypothetical protein
MRTAVLGRWRIMLALVVALVAAAAVWTNVAGGGSDSGQRPADQAPASAKRSGDAGWLTQNDGKRHGDRGDCPERGGGEALMTNADI